LDQAAYEEQARVRVESLFGLADFYSANLRKLGHEAWDVDVNNRFMQYAWAREHGLRLKEGRRWKFRLRRGFVPWLSLTEDGWLYDILRAQITSYRPDVLLTHWIGLDSSFLREMKSHVRLVVGSHASKLHGRYDFSAYNLMLSAVDNFVNYFRSQGLKSELLRFGFEPGILTKFNGSPRTIPVSFVGNIFPEHVSRMHWLEYVCDRVPVQVWAPSLAALRADSPAVRSHRGTAWGAEMFRLLRASGISLNHHIDVAEGYAGNVRLFEATGCGSMLLTDWKTNLHEMFAPGREVVAYRTPEECVELIDYYLNHDAEREAIARAGQQRTLRDHTFYRRMQELSGLVRQYI
jgi:spore maturation protein CgeB